MARAALIKLRRGTGLPADGILEEGELAIDIAAKKLYSANATANAFVIAGDYYNMNQTGNSTFGVVTLTTDNPTFSNDDIFITGGIDTVVAGNTTVINVNSTSTLASVTGRGSTTTTTIGTGNNTVTGFANVTTTLMVGTTSQFKGNAHVGNSTVNVAFTAVGGHIDADGTLTVGGLTALNANTTVTGFANVTTTLMVGTTGQVKGNFHVGNSTVNVAFTAIGGNVDADGTLTVGGLSTLAGRLDVNDTTGSTSTSTGSAVFDGGVGIAENLYVGGNLIVEGTTTQIDSTTVTIDDSLIKLAANQLGTGLDAVDAGLYMTYDVADVQNYSGVFRDQNHANKAWVFIDGITTEPGTTVTYVAGDLAYIEAIIDGGTY